MIKRNLIKFILLYGVYIFTGCNGLYSQNSVSVENNKPIFFDLKSMYRAGLPGKIEADGIQWLNYSTRVDKRKPPVAITVQLGGGEIPEGMELRIKAGDYHGMRKGKPGVSTGSITISNAPKVLINNIRTFSTGKGLNKGHPLKFSFVIKDYSKIEPGTSSIYLLYTLMQ